MKYCYGKNGWIDNDEEVKKLCEKCPYWNKERNICAIQDEE